MQDLGALPRCVQLVDGLPLPSTCPWYSGPKTKLPGAPPLARAPPPLGCQQGGFEAGVTAMKAGSEREKHAKEAGEAAPGEGDGEEEEEKVGSWAAWSKGAGMRWRGRWRERQQGIALCWPPGLVLRWALRVHTVCTPAAGGGEGGGEGC